MEKGKGYVLVERQQHIHIEDDDYRPRFYNYLLKCSVLRLRFLIRMQTKCNTAWQNGWAKYGAI